MGDTIIRSNFFPPQFVTGTTQKNVGSRNYLYNEQKGIYQMFTFKNREFTFDVDVSVALWINPHNLEDDSYSSRMRATLLE